MNKSEVREVAKIKAIMQAKDALPFVGHDAERRAYLGIAARSLAALVRATRTNKARAELLALADRYCLRYHSDFIITRWAD